jgi:hypothetical protein
VLAFHLRLGITATPDAASAGVTKTGAVGIVVVFTGLLVLFEQELNINIDSNESINKNFILITPDNFIIKFYRPNQFLSINEYIFSNVTTGYLSESDFSLSRVLETAAIIPSPIIIITEENIQIGDTFNLKAAKASPPATNKIPIKYIEKFDIVIFLVLVDYNAIDLFMEIKIGLWGWGFNRSKG